MILGTITLVNMKDSSKVFVKDPDGLFWIDWWREHTGSKRTTCYISGCKDKAEGAHMVPKGCDKPVFILPLCHKHNEDPDLEIEIDGDSDYLVHCPDKYRKDRQ